MRISDWSSDVCSSDLPINLTPPGFRHSLERQACGITGFPGHAHTDLMTILANRTNSCTHPFFLCDLAMENEPETLLPVSLPSRTTRQKEPITVGFCLRKITRRGGPQSSSVKLH